jgi:hypothetical protein
LNRKICRGLAPEARRAQAVLRREDQREDEEQALQRHDAAARRAVEKVAGIGPDQRGAHAHGRGESDHAAEAVGQQVGGGPGRDQHGNHEAGPDSLQRGDRRGGKQRQQQVVEHGDVEPDGAGLVGIEAEQPQVAPLQPEHRQRHRGDDGHLHDVRVGDAEDVAKDDGAQVHAARADGNQEEPEGEKGREDHADDRILPEARLRLHESHARRRQQARAEGPRGKRPAQRVGHGHPGHDRVRKRVAHQRPALEGDEAREERAHPADQPADRDGLQHVVVFQRREERLNHGHTSDRMCNVLRYTSSQARRQPYSHAPRRPKPCSGNVS